ncbi:DUF3459 domain-containing protein, partial [Clostridium perfringens]|uniref:DUF3459 domain-containing protein n=1 Tax=Clostridium perfringens TaxID=1502 RepID=UPI0018E4493D
VYRQLIKLRHHYDIITYGDIEPLYMDHPQLFIYRRNYKNDSWLIIANFSNETVRIPDDLDIVGDIIIQSGTILDNKISPYGAIVICKSY